MVSAEPTPFRLRQATPEDACAIAEVHARARREAMPWLPELHTDEETRAWVASVVLPGQEVWVPEVDGRVVGVAALEGEMLEQLYILPEHQGHGIGSALFDLVTTLRPAGFRFYVFQRNTQARAFYERRGCLPLAFGDGCDNEEGEPDVLYRWAPRSSTENRMRR